ncbi:MAG: DsbC family protein, partial [Deltaproteobacteria bacterium]|nr:DsbC family protein [Deltaproteobacteria bacterium]
ELAKADKNILVYVDFAKKYLVEGQFTKLEDLGKPLEVKRLDTSKIPLADALIMGNPSARNKVIVFDDPDCPYCKKFHNEIKKIIAKRDDIVFYLKLFPLPIHPEAHDKSRAILCNRSIAMLEDAFEGKTLPKPECEAKEIDENVRLARELGIGGTPTLILPDGRVIPGYVDADTFISILDSP